MQSVDDAHDAKFACVERALYDRKAIAVIEAAERMRSTGAVPENYCRYTHLMKGRQEPAQDRTIDLRYVAGQDQVPIGFRGCQNSFEACQRAQARAQIGEARKIELSVAGRLADKNNWICEGREHFREVFRGRFTLPRQQGFVAAHAGTASSSKDITRGLHGDILHAGMLHAGMLASGTELVLVGLGGYEKKQFQDIEIRV